MEDLLHFPIDTVNMKLMSGQTFYMRIPTNASKQQEESVCLRAMRTPVNILTTSVPSQSPIPTQLPAQSNCSGLPSLEYPLSHMGVSFPPPSYSNSAMNISSSASVSSSPMASFSSSPPSTPRHSQYDRFINYHERENTPHQQYPTSSSYQPVPQPLSYYKSTQEENQAYHTTTSYPPITSMQTALANFTPEIATLQPPPFDPLSPPNNNPTVAFSGSSSSLTHLLDLLTHSSMSTYTRKPQPDSPGAPRPEGAPSQAGKW